MNLIISGNLNMVSQAGMLQDICTTEKFPMFTVMQSYEQTAELPGISDAMTHMKSL